jgi:hypothetical protein
MRRIATLALLAAAVCTACGGEPAGTEYPTSPAVPLLAELVGVWDMDMHVVSRRGCGFADGGCEADTVSYMVLGGLAFVGGPVDSSRWYGADAVATVTATLVLDGKQWRDPDATCSGRGTGCYSQRLTARLLSVDTTRSARGVHQCRLEQSGCPAEEIPRDHRLVLSRSLEALSRMWASAPPFLPHLLSRL